MLQLKESRHFSSHNYELLMLACVWFESVSEQTYNLFSKAPIKWSAFILEHQNMNLDKVEEARSFILFHLAKTWRRSIEFQGCMILQYTKHKHMQPSQKGENGRAKDMLHKKLQQNLWPSIQYSCKIYVNTYMTHICYDKH